jgi:flagellar biosynthesis/type III secretory pathway ATPase
VHLHLRFLRNLQRVVNLQPATSPLQKQAKTTIPPYKLPGRGQSTTGQRLDIGIGDGFLGRAVDPFGRPLDGGPVPQSNRRRALEVPSPRITARDFDDRPFLRRSKMVDTMIPNCEGERQLIIGDAATGRSAPALDTLIAQKGRDFWCVYVPAATRHWDSSSGWGKLMVDVLAQLHLAGIRCDREFRESGARESSRLASGP